MLNINKYNLFYATLTFVFALLCVHFSYIDILISSKFYNQDQGFYMRAIPFVKFINHFSSEILFCFLAITLTWIGAKRFIETKSLNIRDYLDVIYIFVVFSIGAGLIVNILFKNNIFGRARPEQILCFGGEKHFTGAFTITDQCLTNCSFVSGHASVWFGLISFLFIARESLRKYILYCSIMMGFAIGFVRVISGKHFLSDVLFAGIIMFWTSYLLACFFQKYSKTNNLVSL